MSCVLTPTSFSSRLTKQKQETTQVLEFILRILSLTNMPFVTKERMYVEFVSEKISSSHHKQEENLFFSRRENRINFFFTFLSFPREVLSSLSMFMWFLPMAVVSVSTLYSSESCISFKNTLSSVFFRNIVLLHDMAGMEVDT